MICNHCSKIDSCTYPINMLLKTIKWLWYQNTKLEFTTGYICRLAWLYTDDKGKLHLIQAESITEYESAKLTFFSWVYLQCTCIFYNVLLKTSYLLMQNIARCYTKSRRSKRNMILVRYSVYLLSRHDWRNYYFLSEI
jgi:hypothetical protein